MFQVEYTDADLATWAAEICPFANPRDFDTLIKHLELDGARHACR